MQGKAAVVTGASSGIGEATALALAEAGASVTLVGRRAERLSRVASEVESRGGSAQVMAADLQDPEASEAVIRGAVERWGRLDVLVNNAGVGFWEPVDSARSEEWQAEVAVNLVAPMVATRAAAQVMLEQGSGHVVNISSLAARYPGPGAAGYAASKAGMTSFSDSMHAELRGRGVRVTVVETGEVATEMQSEADRASMAMLTAAEVADAVLWVVSRPPRVVIRTIQLLAGGDGPA